MTYVINAACIDVHDGSCVEVCPADCIYAGDRKLYINPLECIDCGVCEDVCPVEAIVPERLLTPNDEWLRDQETFFETILPGRSEPLGQPGGASVTGPIGTDTPRVSAA